MKPRPMVFAAAEQLGRAIARAAREHGAPNAFYLRELHEHYGGPKPLLGWLALARARTFVRSEAPGYSIEWRSGDERGPGTVCVQPEGSVVP